MTKGLLTTSVGSFPKPPYLTQARNRHAAGRMELSELRELERQATREWIQIQEELGIDILVDGEQYRGDMVTYFAEEMEGFAISGLVRSYGNRYYRKPIAVGPVGRKSPITVEMYKYAQSLTSRPVKGMLTGPYTMVDWSFNEHYPSREAFVMDLARVVHEEALDLERAGAKYIQIDEPAASTRPEEMDLVARGLKVVTDGLSAFTITHVCYGDFAAVFDKLINLPVDQLDLEMTNSSFDLLELFRGRKFEKTLAMGVVDVHTHVTEGLEDVKAGIRRGLEVFPPERLYIDPDCGLKTRTVEEARAKLAVIAQAVREVKQELGIE
ncbi:MAG: 5-methyltetrahydropteroyltriglutamate--homocysteine methyltransferase [Dehalococcoidia bacterium]|nr:5-methyltetrahydropteroyltriglutamate--homocysteine methyltransferase [Dehalococcoidia bacterium]